MKNDIEFSAPPKIGTRVRAGGREYRMLGHESYIRRDGAESALLTWEVRCAECDRPFRLTTGLVSKALNRRCEEHRASGKPASKAAAKRVARHFGRKSR